MNGLATILLLLTPPVAVASEQLGDDEFRNREAASRALTCCGVLAYPALAEALESRDAEVRYRAKRLLCEQRRCFAASFARGVVIWIDMLPPETEDRYGVIAEYLQRARLTVAPSGEPLWLDYSAAMRQYTRALIIDGAKPGDVRIMLDRSAVIQAEWVKRNPPRR